jgi:hypothetical protein
MNDSIGLFLHMRLQLEKTQSYVNNMNDADYAGVLTLHRLTVVKVLFYPTLPGLGKNIVFWKVPRLHPFIFLERTTYR